MAILQKTQGRSLLACVVGGVLRWVVLDRVAHVVPIGDERTYVETAIHIARGEGHVFGPHRIRAGWPPAHPWLLSHFVDLERSDPPERFRAGLRPLLEVQVVLGTLLVLATALLGRAFFDARVGLLAAAIAAVFPSLVAYSHYLWSDTLFALLLTSALALLAAAERRRRAAGAGLTGVLLGAAALTRELAIPLALACAFWWWWTAPPAGRRRAGLEALVLLGLAGLVILPWTLRNAALFGRPVPVSTVGWILLPHRPWRFLPSGRSYYPWYHWGIEKTGDTNAWSGDEFWVVQGYQRHLLQVGFCDALVGELLAALEDAGLYDRALLIVTADHGAAFAPNASRRQPARMPHPEEVVGVPLRVKPPHRRDGRVSLRNVETIDVLPTVAEVLGIAIPWPVDGCSLLDPGCPARPHKRVVTREGEELRLDAGLTLRTAALERRRRWFGAHEGPDALYAVARVTGAPQPPPREGETVHLAVVVGGVVRAVAPVLRDAQGGAFFSAMLPEHAAPRRPSELEIFAVEGAAGDVRLRRLATTLGGS